jgi:hypothetical protein
MFLDLTRAAITIVSLIDNQTYTYPVDTIKLLTSILIMSRANEESATKAKRVCAASQKKPHDIGTANREMADRQAGRKGFDVDPQCAAASSMTPQIAAEAPT